MNRFGQSDYFTGETAGVGLKSGVCPDVSPQVEVKRELLAANLAFVRSLALITVRCGLAGAA